MFGVQLPPHSKTLHVHTQALSHTAEQLENRKESEREEGKDTMTVVIETVAQQQHLQPLSDHTTLPLASCRPDSWVWPGTGRTAGMYAVCFRAWLQKPAPLAEGRDASAAPAD